MDASKRMEAPLLLTFARPPADRSTPSRRPTASMTGHRPDPAEEPDRHQADKRNSHKAPPITNQPGSAGGEEQPPSVR